MKTTAVVESLSYYKTNVLFQRIPAYFKIDVIAFYSYVILPKLCIYYYGSYFKHIYCTLVIQ